METDLKKLYLIINSNLRDLLACANDYCLYVHEQKDDPIEEEDKHAKFEAWLYKESASKYEALQPRISRDAWKLLDTAMSTDLNGTFGPGDFAYFKHNSLIPIIEKTFQNDMKKFEDLGIIARSVHDTEGAEKKRTTYTVTTKGCFVHYARLIKSETHTMAPQPEKYTKPK
jgi:hypothetical protein